MTGPLDQSACDEFQANGYLCCPSLLSESQTQQISQMVTDIAGWPEDDERCLHYHELTDEGRVLTRTERFLANHQGLRTLLTDGVINAAVSQLFGEAATVFKEKINYKLSGGGGFAPHQDAQAYAYGSVHITCLVAVDPNTIDNGCLWFTPGMHANGLLDTDDSGCLPPEQADAMSWEPVTLPPGGAVFFSSFAPHKSQPNQTAQSRRSLYVTYSKASEGDLRAEYYAERDRAMACHDVQADQPPRISTIGHFQGKGVD